MKNTVLHTAPLSPSLVKKKYLVINLTKYVSDLDVENYKTLIKVIIKDPNQWKDILC